VRNITDVGHLENDSDSGEDKIAQKARLEQLEPMEVVQHYTIRYHEAMKLLNTLPPSIEPRASAHIIEQISLVNKILNNGYAYESNGSVYFDVESYNKKYPYGALSGRSLEDMMSNTRELEGQSDKRSNFDFALWKKAAPEHIMKWPSPWSEGFPGWHLECSAMSAKYLGENFDIHGGGMDLLFPHHECELAQNTAARGEGGVRYWMHNNMITINGQKMGKSLGNFITLEELFKGEHKLLTQPFSPMTIRFFILQAHYRSTLDFSNDALVAAEKGYKRMMAAASEVKSLKTVAGSISDDIKLIEEGVMTALLDDMNTPVAVAHLFDAVRIVNSVKDGLISICQKDKETLSAMFDVVVKEILGLADEKGDGDKGAVFSGVMEMILEMRREAKVNKEFAKSDAIRERLTSMGISIKDTKEGTEWYL
ncbi:MAG: cysteine--tRNA ligase, partial [Bacteroidales bacterium]|nr:cysteine--tRNA ligase [Bacteroidales bacterium]